MKVFEKIIKSQLLSLELKVPIFTLTVEFSFIAEQ